MLHLNQTSHCTMCAAERPGRHDVRNYNRTHLGDGKPRIAVCRTHDVAGPASAYPLGLRIVAGLEG